tara:strand:+ start:1429 stop:1977 length:549 start_codon:yes stop_codon:yes gene_type:complete
MDLTLTHRLGIFSLKIINYDDLKFLMELRNHPETRKFLGYSLKISMNDQQAWFNRLKTATDKLYFIFQFQKLSSDKVEKIGMIRIHDIDCINKNMGVGGDIHPLFRGKGYGKIMYDLIFQLGFEKMKMHRLWLSVVEFNTVARNLYIKKGFMETGIQREAIFKNGKYVNYIYMDILNREYLK